MGIHLAEQTLAFLYACVLGAVLGTLYDLFRILRLAFPAGRGMLFIQDLLFWILCSIASFLFLLTNSDGVVRVFLLIGELLGGVLYHYTLGVLIMRIASTIIDACRAAARFLMRFFILPLWKLLYGVIQFLLRPVRFFGGFLKNYLIRVKLRLKVGRLVLYNHCTGTWRKMVARKPVHAHSSEEIQKHVKKRKQKRKAPKKA